MNGMLSVLLFAGAVHVDLAELAARKWAIGLMASVGVLTSTLLVGVTMWFAMGAMGIEIPFLWPWSLAHSSVRQTRWRFWGS